MPTTCGQGLAERAPLPAKLADAFNAFVTREHETLDLLHASVDRDEAMLGEMQTALR
jgi:hypothetical protein